MDPYLAIVAKELAHRRMTTDRTLLMFSALPNAPVRAVAPPNRLRRLTIAARRRWPSRAAGGVGLVDTRPQADATVDAEHPGRSDHDALGSRRCVAGVGRA